MPLGPKKGQIPPSPPTLDVFFPKGSNPDFYTEIHQFLKYHYVLNKTHL